MTNVQWKSKIQTCLISGGRCTIAKDETCKTFHKLWREISAINRLLINICQYKCHHMRKDFFMVQVTEH